MLTQNQVTQRMFIYKIIFIFFSFVGCFFLGSSVFASNVYFTTPSTTIAVGDVVPVEIRLNTESISVNVVEGSIALQTSKQGLEMRELSVAGADVTLWSRKPSWDKNAQSVTLVGGEPGGFNKSDALIFKMFFIPESEGQITLMPDFKIYANDGKGTVVPVSITPLSFTVVEQGATPKDEWKKTVATDNIPPELLSAEIGQDVSVYDGKLFLVIHGEDSQSGIDHYEVKEGDRDPVRSGTEYVLQDQDQSTKITIAAIDKAGNVRILEMSSVSKKINPYYLYSILGFLVIIIISVVIILRRRKKHL